MGNFIFFIFKSCRNLPESIWLTSVESFSSTLGTLILEMFLVLVHNILKSELIEKCSYTYLSWNLKTISGSSSLVERIVANDSVYVVFVLLILNNLFLSHIGTQYGTQWVAANPEPRSLKTFSWLTILAQIIWSHYNRYHTMTHIFADYN